MLAAFPEFPEPNTEVEKFRRLGKVGVECLLQVVATKDYEVAGKAARVLGWLRATSAIAALQALFPKVSHYTQHRIVLAYGDMREPALIPELSRLARSGDHEQEAIEALGNSRLPEAIPLLIKRLEDAKAQNEWSWRRKMAAAAGLLHFTGDVVIDALTDLLRLGCGLSAQRTKINESCMDDALERAALGHLAKMDSPRAHRNLFSLIADSSRSSIWEKIAQAIEGAGILPADASEAALLALARGKMLKAARGGASLVRKILVESSPRPTPEQWAELVGYWKSTPDPRIADELLRLLGETPNYTSFDDHKKALVTALIELEEWRVAVTITDRLAVHGKFSSDAYNRWQDREAIVEWVNAILPLLHQAITKLGPQIPTETLKAILSLTPLKTEVPQYEMAGDAVHCVGSENVTTAPQLERVQQAAQAALAKRN